MRTCSTAGCIAAPETRSMCHTHYMRWYTSDRGQARCSVENCDNAVYAKHMCAKHRRRVLRYGSPQITKDARSMTTTEYIYWRTTIEDSGCWLWDTPHNSHGYGVASRGGKKIAAHRLSYSHFVGDIQPGQDVRHKCDSRACVNPDHLELGTRADNNRDTSARDRHGNAKVSNNDVVDIRWAHGMGASGASLARAYGVTPTLVSQIVRHKARTNA